MKTSDATISADGLYRYDLRRKVARGRSIILWVMLNPSTADATVDDPTIRRCIQFTKDWGHSILVVVNLFAWRATDPKELKKAFDPVGPLNDKTIKVWMDCADRIVVGWGANGSLYHRDEAFREMAQSRMCQLWCLGKTKAGHPRHPLYVRSTQELERW